MTLLGAEEQRQVNARVGRRHQLLVRQSSSEAACQTAWVTALNYQHIVKETAHDYLHPLERESAQQLEVGSARVTREERRCNSP